MKLDKFLVAVSISIFILAGLFILFETLYGQWDTGFPLAGLGTAGFLGWATYYAAGAGKDGLVKGIPANLSGVFWGIVIVFIWDKVFGFNNLGAFVAVGIGGGMMCFQAHFKALGFIPGAFIGCSTFFALGAAISGAVLFPAVIGLLAGLFLGYISEQFALLIKAKVLKA